MAAFAFDAINAQGLEYSGVIHAADLGAAREQLQSRGRELAAQPELGRRAGDPGGEQRLGLVGGQP